MNMKFIIRCVREFFNRSRFWRSLWVSESPQSFWEMVHDSSEKTVVLHYIPNSDYSDDDVKIELNYDEFQDLLDFARRLNM